MVFGPGRISDAHATGERISLRDIERAAAAVATLIARWCELA